MNSFLVASSVESIRKAFDRALLICGSRQSLREENLFLRSLIRGQISQTVVFDQEGNLFLSTLDAPVPELLEMLRRELPESQKDVERRITRNLGGMLYAIRARQVGAGSAVYTAFFLEARKTPLSPSQSGIRFSSCPEAERAFDDSIFSFAETISDFQTEIAQINQSRAPVLVTGEDGTGKETIVYFLYMRSSLQNHPLISINCSLLNDRSWAFLLEHHNSPLADQDSTLYFSSIDVLSEERQRQLLAVLLEMDVCRRNRVILSCVCQPGEYVSAAGALFLDKLRCLSLYLPPLRSMPQRIPTLVNLSLSHLNASIPRQVVGVEPDGVSLLQSFRWPHNYMQFRRVIKSLAVTAAGQVITAESVREVLKKERHMGVFSLRAENAAVPLDLGRTLEEINQDVALRVLEETGGNQTAAAKRLGISRLRFSGSLRNRRRLVQKGPVHPVVHADAVVVLPPQVEHGHAEERRQLLLLVLGGGLTAGLKFLHRHPGKAQCGGQGGAAEAPFASQLSNALCHGDHMMILLAVGFSPYCSTEGEPLATAGGVWYHRNRRILRRDAPPRDLRPSPAPAVGEFPPRTAFS